MRFLTALFISFLLVGSLWAGAVTSKDPPLAKVVFYVG
jgi:hypothetical protein